MKNQSEMKRYQLSVVLLLSLCTQLPGFAQQTKTVTLLQTSDVHSRVEPIATNAADAYAGLGGLVRRATMVEELRRESPGLLLVDCGDFSQGTPYYNLFRGEVEVKMMNDMKYDAVAIGNHEFDFGLDNMARLFRLAEFPIVCANYGVEGTVLAGLVKPYVVLVRDGLRIGIFGLSPKMAGLVQADKCEGVTYKDPVTTANEVAAKLKKEEKCDVIVCLSHLGIEKDRTRLIPKTRNIDVVLGGHSHTLMKEPQVALNPDGKSVSLFHTGKSGVFVGRTELSFTKK